ncbi:MAG: platelet-activating factor acetylhydrolase IB subunit [Candidatus Ratteibacteria bacterium]|nr:platelet-activating factor acetylhydrolase IB subunit [Candidatus Ratteibacteria bacterium]
MKKIFAALFLTLICSACSSEIPQNAATIPVPQPKSIVSGPNSWTPRFIKKNQAVKNGNIDLVFIGDSITAGWETGAGKEIWEKYYSKKKSLNLGFGGDRTEHVIWRLQNGNFDGINPKLVVLMIGTNNTGRRMDNPVMIAEGIKLIIETIHLKSPSTKILLLGIFPREKTKDGPMRKNNDNVNEIIKNYPKNYKFVDYLDISKNFLNEDGTLSREIMYDLLHLTSKGYGILAEALEEKIKELMEE